MFQKVTIRWIMELVWPGDSDRYSREGQVEVGWLFVQVVQTIQAARMGSTTTYLGSQW